MMDINGIKKNNSQAEASESNRLIQEIRVKESILGLPYSDTSGMTWDSLRRRLNTLQEMTNKQVLIRK